MSALALMVALASAASPLGTADDRFALVLVGEIDARLQSAEVEGLNGLSLARFRIGGRAAPVSWFRLVGTAEWAQEKPALNDAYFELLPLDGLEVLVGYSKTPLFITGKSTRVEALSIPERSLVVRALWPRRDLGVEVHWRPLFAPVEMWGRFGNGSGSPLGNDDPRPAGDARVDLTLGRERRGDEGSTWGLRAGLGAHAEDAFDRPGIGGFTTQGFLFYRPPVVSGPRAVVEGHVAAGYGPFRLLVEGGSGWERRSRDTDGNPNTPREALPTVSSHGVSAELSWVLRGLPRLELTWPGEPPRTDGSTEWNGGSLELTARFERVWLGREATDVEAGGAAGGAASLRWWVNTFFGVGIAGYLMRYDRAPLELPDTLYSWLVLTRATVSFR